MLYHLHFGGKSNYFRASLQKPEIFHMKKPFLLVLLAFASALVLHAQTELSYYLPPNTQYNQAIPTPPAVIGHNVGEWHITHDRLVTYMKALDQASDRITLEQTGLT